MINLILKELKDIFSNKKIFVFILVSISLLIGTYFVAGNSKSETSISLIRIGVVDKDQSTYSRMLIDYFSNNESFSKYASLIKDDEDVIDKMFMNGELTAYLIIPDNFVNDLIYVEQTKIEGKVSAEDTTTAIIIKNILDSYATYISSVQINAMGLYDIMGQSNMEQELIDQTNNEISIDLIMTALSRTDFFDFHELEEIPSMPIIIYYFWAILSIIILFVGMIPGFRLLREKNSGTLDRLRVVGNSIYSYILSLLIIYTTLFSGIFIIIVKFYDHFNPIHQLVRIYIALIVYVLFANVFGLFLALICKNGKTFLLTANIIYLLSCILGGIMIPLMFLPEKLMFFSRGTINYWFLKLVLNIQKNNYKNDLVPILILLICLIISYICIRLARNTKETVSGGTYE